MDVRKTPPNHRRTYRLLRSCYRCFLLHLILGLSVSLLLLLSVIRIAALLPAVPTALAGAILPRSGTRYGIGLSADILPRAAISCAVYIPGDTADVLFGGDASDIRTSVIRHTPSAEETVCRTKDSETDPALPPPTLSSDAQDSTAADASQKIPAAHIPLRTTDLSAPSRRSESVHGILFSNQTAYTPDAADYLERAYPIPAHDLPVIQLQGAAADAPLVLILHTHGTEAYAPDGSSSVPPDYTYRSEDTAENVVSVGAVLADVLCAAHIPTLHCKTMFDAASYNDAYVRSADYIRRTLAAYPSIRYVFDVHRDALQDTDGAVLRPVTRIGGEECAQVMSVVGTDGAGGSHPDWQENLTVAVHLQKRLNDACPSLARPINLRSATFNAQYAVGSLLLEIGASGNSAAEARSAAYHLGRVLADMILQGQ